MSFFKYIWRSFLVLLILGIAIFIGLREYYLFIAKEIIKNDLTKLANTANTPQIFQLCLGQAGALVDSQQEIVKLQLRFINDRDYNLESVCAGFEFSPELIDSGSLPAGVRKKPGSSGLVLASGAWQLGLQYLPEKLTSLPLPKWLLNWLKTRTVFIFVENKRQVDTLTQAPDLETPTTNCVGYGYSCCDQVTQMGLGESRPATDCVDSCFSSCAQRPTILSFSVLGGQFDQYARTLHVKSGEKVDFFYQVADFGVAPINAEIKFGDGKIWQDQSDQDSTSHTYTCDVSECVYQATLTLTDAKSVSSVINPISNLQVVVEQW